MGALSVEAAMPNRGPCCTTPVLCSEACHARVEQLLAGIRPGNSSLERRTRITEYMQQVVSECFSDSQSAVHLVQFGSVPLMTFLPDGDIDLSIMSADTTLRETWATRLFSWLEEEQLRQEAAFRITNVQIINAEVKLLKCLVDNIVVDISYHQVGGITALRFLEEVDKLIDGHIFKRSIILVKAWCYYESRVLGAHHGLFSTYALEVLVLYVFNVHHKHIKSPLEVLYLFLHECGHFDWERYCLSLKGRIPLNSFPEVTVEPLSVDDLLLSSDVEAECLRRAREHEILAGIQVGHTTPSPTPPNSTGAVTSQDAGPPILVAARPPASFTVRAMNIQDPLQATNNVGRSVTKSNLFRVRKAFAYGASVLAKVMCKEGDECCAAFDDFFRNVWNAQRQGRHTRHHAPLSPTPQLPASLQQQQLPQQPVGQPPQQTPHPQIQAQQPQLQPPPPTQQQQQGLQQQQAVGPARDQPAHPQHMQAMYGGYVQLPRAGATGGRASPLAQANGNGAFMYSRSPVGDLQPTVGHPHGGQPQQQQQQQQQRGAQRGYHGHAASMPSTPSGQQGSSSSTPPLDDNMVNAVLHSTAHMAAIQAVSDGGLHHQPQHGHNPASMLNMYHPQQAALFMAQYQQVAMNHHQIMSMANAQAQAQAQHMQGMQGMQHAAETAAAAYKGPGVARRMTDPHAASNAAARAAASMGPASGRSDAGRMDSNDSMQMDSQSRQGEYPAAGGVGLDAQDGKSQRSTDEHSGGRVRMPLHRDVGEGVSQPAEGLQAQEGASTLDMASEAFADRAHLSAAGQSGKEPRSASVPAEVGAAAAVAAGSHQHPQGLVASAGNSPSPHFDYRTGMPLWPPHMQFSSEQIQQMLAMVQMQAMAARQPDLSAAQRRNSSGISADGVKAASSQGGADSMTPAGQQHTALQQQAGAEGAGVSRMRASTGVMSSAHSNHASMQQAPQMHPAAAIQYARANPGFDFQLHGLSPTMPYWSHLPAPPPPSVAPIHHSPPSIAFQVNRNMQRMPGPAPTWPPQQVAPAPVRQSSNTSQPRHTQSQHGGNQQFLSQPAEQVLQSNASGNSQDPRPHSGHAGHIQQAAGHKAPGKASNSSQPFLTGRAEADMQTSEQQHAAQRRVGGAHPSTGQPPHYADGMDGQPSIDLAWQPSGVWSEDMEGSFSGDVGELVSRAASKGVLTASVSGVIGDVANMPSQQGATATMPNASGPPSQPPVAQLPSVLEQPAGAAGQAVIGGTQAAGSVPQLASMNNSALMNMLVPPQQLPAQLAVAAHAGGSLPASFHSSLAQLNVLQGVQSNASTGTAAATSSTSATVGAAMSSGGVNSSVQHAPPSLPALPPNTLMGHAGLSAMQGTMMLPMMDATAPGSMIMGMPATRSNPTVTGTPLQVNMNMPMMMGSIGMPHMPSVVQGMPVPNHPAGQGSNATGAAATHSGVPVSAMFNAAFMDMLAAQHGLSRPPQFIQAPIPPPPIPGMLPPPLSSSARPMSGYFPPFLPTTNAAGAGPVHARGNANEAEESTNQATSFNVSSDLTGIPHGAPALLPMLSNSSSQPQQSQATAGLPTSTAAGAVTGVPLSPGKQPASQSAPLCAQLPAATAAPYAATGLTSLSSVPEGGRVVASGTRTSQGRTGSTVSTGQMSNTARTGATGPYAIQTNPSSTAAQSASDSMHMTPSTASPRGPSQAGAAAGVPWAQELPTATAAQTAVSLQPAQQLLGASSAGAGPTDQLLLAHISGQVAEHAEPAGGASQQGLHAGSQSMASAQHTDRTSVEHMGSEGGAGDRSSSHSSRHPSASREQRAQPSYMSAVISDTCDSNDGAIRRSRSWVAVASAAEGEPRQEESAAAETGENLQSAELVPAAQEQAAYAQQAVQQQRSRRSGPAAALVAADGGSSAGSSSSNRPPTGRSAAGLTSRSSHDPQRQGRGTDSPVSTIAQHDLAASGRASLVTPPKRLTINLEPQLSNDTSSIPSTSEQDDGKQPSSLQSAAARKRPLGSPGLADAGVAMVRQALAGVGSQLSKGASRALTHHARTALQSCLSHEELACTRGSGGLESAGGSGTLHAQLSTRLSGSHGTATATSKAASGHLASNSSIGDADSGNLPQAVSVAAPASNRSASPISKDSSWSNLHAATRPSSSRSRGNSGAATPALSASGGLNVAGAPVAAASAAAASSAPPAPATSTGRTGHSGGGSAGSSGRPEGAGPRLAHAGAAWQLQHMMNSLQQASREAGAGQGAARREAASGARPSLDRTPSGTRSASAAAATGHGTADVHAHGGSMSTTPQRSSGSGLLSPAADSSQAPKNMSSSASTGLRTSGGGQQAVGAHTSGGGSGLGARRSSSSLSTLGSKQQGQASGGHSHTRGGAMAGADDDRVGGGLAHRSSGEIGHRRSGEFGQRRSTGSLGAKGSQHGAATTHTPSQPQQTGGNFKLEEEEFPHLGRPSTTK